MKHIIFTAREMNWGTIHWGIGAWLSTQWTIYNDGEFLEEIEYDKDTFCRVTDTASTEIKRIREGKMSTEKLDVLKKILEEKFNNCLAGAGCDGIGWKMCSYGKNGTIAHQVSGYIYGNDTLEEISQLLHNAQI